MLISKGIYAHIDELIESSEVISSIVSSILDVFSTKSNNKLIESLLPKVCACVELSRQYKCACIEVAAKGACESSITMLKQQLMEGNTFCLRDYVTNMREALSLCDICLFEFNRAFEQTKRDIIGAKDSTVHKTTIAETGIKDSSIAIGIGAAAMFAGFLVAVPPTIFAPPVGLGMICAGAAGTVTFAGGAIGRGIHGFNKRSRNRFF